MTTILKAEIRALKKRIADLERENAALKAGVTYAGGWTPPEADVIRRGYAAGWSTAIIQAELARIGSVRTIQAIRTRAGILGIERAGRHPAWSDAEKAILFDHYGSEGARGVKRRLLEAGFKRSLAAIYLWATKLGVAGEGRGGPGVKKRPSRPVMPGRLQTLTRRAA